MNDNSLIMCTRFPAPGKCKTRLIPALGENGSAELQRRMAEKILTTCQKACNTADADFQLRHTGADDKQMREWLGPNINLADQGDSKYVGDRIQKGFDENFGEEHKKVIMIGSDCPNITVEIICEAFAKLDTHDLIIGPTNDGGFYLLGLRVEQQTLFENIHWGTETVLSELMRNAASTGLSIATVPTVTDVDTAEDLKCCPNLLKGLM